MRIHFFQHVPFEGLAAISGWIESRGHSLTSTAFFEEDAQLPDVTDYDALIVMGGPMGVYDGERYPWLDREIDHIREAVRSGKAVLGICLGAQLISAALGGHVAPHSHREIGWFPITLTEAAAGQPVVRGLPQSCVVFHWHGDRFEIPPGAVHLARSEGCDNQAFLYGTKVLGLQFHLEMDEAALTRMTKEGSAELKPARWVQTRDSIAEGGTRYRTQDLLYALLDNWISEG